MCPIRPSISASQESVVGRAGGGDANKPPGHGLNRDVPPQRLTAASTSSAFATDRTCGLHDGRPASRHREAVPGATGRSYDLIPDFIAVLGYADDAIIVTLVLRSVVRRAGIDAVQARWPGSEDGFEALGRLAGLNGSTRPRN